MCSRSRASLPLIWGLSALMMLALGCDRYLNRQSTPKSDEVELKTEALTCLHPVPERVGLWIRDELSAADVETSFKCFRTTVYHFDQHARGRGNSEDLTASELLTFINQALPRGRELNGEMMGHLMKIKTVFFGGSAEVLTRAELRRVSLFLDAAEKQILQLTGWMRILLFQSGKVDEQGRAILAVSTEELREAQKRLKQAAQVFLQKSFIESSSYEFHDLVKFVHAMNGYLQNPTLMAQFIRWLPFTEAIKDLLLGKNVEFGSRHGWQEHLEWITKAYNAALDYFYMIRPLQLDKPSDHESLIVWGEQVLDILETSRAMETKSLLAMPEILAVVDRFVDTGVLKTSVDNQTLRRILPESLCRAVANFLEGPQTRSLACHEVGGLSAKGLSILRFEWNTWVLAQKQILSAFQGKTVITYGDFLQSVRTFKVGAGRRGLKVSSLEKDYLDRTFADWKELMSSDFPMLWGPNQRLIVKSVQHLDPISFDGMTWVNLFRTMTRMVLRGYGVAYGRNIFQYQLRQGDLERLEYDFREFGRAIRFLDPRTPNPAARTFQEASFFTPHGQGAPFLTGREVFEELNILVSAGGQTANAIYKRIIPTSDKPMHDCKRPGVDVFGKHYLEETCTMAVIRKHFPEFFGSVPGLVAMHHETLQKNTRDTFDKNLLDLARLPDETKPQPGLIGYGEIRTMSTVLYYIEILRLVYDRNQDGKLSMEEVRNAQSRFYAFIDALIKQEKIPWVISSWKTISVEDVFPCLVFEQKKPGTSCLILGLGDDVQVGLPELLKVLGVLKASMPK